jgi:glutamyl-tRNA reductase
MPSRSRRARTTSASATCGRLRRDSLRVSPHILQTIDKRLENHESQKASLQALFKTMLNKLMTGRIRVKDLDIDTAEVEVG